MATSQTLGKKRVCAGCAVRYYDLRKAIPVCPKCGLAVDLSFSEKSKRKFNEDLSDFDAGSGDIDLVEQSTTLELESNGFDEDLSVMPTDETDEL
ncbi:MAG: FYDLN acid domain-containing protein [Holosporales bacterium]|jgi:uncharacterized protein (TIGR02300 family)|nr:FYDLN acid domain-containing protein [Holosporales bacterium]